MSTPATSVGASVALHPSSVDADDLVNPPLVRDCHKQCGGDMTVKPQAYELAVTNLPDENAGT